MPHELAHIVDQVWFNARIKCSIESVAEKCELGWVCVYLILNLIIITLHVMGSAKWNGRQKKSTSNNDDVDDGDGDDYDQCFCLWICYLMQHKRPLNHLYVYRHTTHTSHCRLRIVNVFIALQRLQRTTQLVFNHSTKCEHFVRCAHQTNENVSACHAVWDMCYEILICFSSFFSLSTNSSCYALCSCACVELRKIILIVLGSFQHHPTHWNDQTSTRMIWNRQIVT